MRKLIFLLLLFSSSFLFSQTGNTKFDTKDLFLGFQYGMDVLAYKSRLIQLYGSKEISNFNRFAKTPNFSQCSNCRCDQYKFAYSFPIQQADKYSWCRQADVIPVFDDNCSYLKGIKIEFTYCSSSIEVTKTTTETMKEYLKGDFHEYDKKNVIDTAKEYQVLDEIKSLITVKYGAENKMGDNYYWSFGHKKITLKIDKKHYVKFANREKEELQWLISLEYEYINDSQEAEKNKQKKRAKTIGDL